MELLAEHEDGVFYDIPNEVYHSGPGLSNSQMGELAKSPAHYFGAYLHPKRPPRKTLPGQLEGSMAHCAFLEAIEFSKRYVVGPDVNKNTNEWKGFIKALPPGATGIKLEESEAAWAQAASLRTLPDVAEVMARGRAEVSAYWHQDVVIDADTGEFERVQCRVRPDFVHPVDEKRVILLDVKTCGSASPDEFARQIARKSYHRQAALYSDGFEKASGMEVLAFLFAQVESSWPFVAGCCVIDSRALDAGRNEYRRLVALYAQCKRENRWPPYSEKAVHVEIPSWALR